jgi:hypothetical protein
MRTIIAVLLIALSSISCATSRPEPQAIDPRCVQFSQPFLMAAQVRQGRSLEDSLSILAGVESENPSESDLFAEKAMRATVRFVYAHPDLSPKELQRRVQLACSIDNNGKIQFNGL